MPEQIRFSCPVCHKDFAVDKSYAGYKFPCACGQRLEVPRQPTNKTVLGKIEDFPADLPVAELLPVASFASPPPKIWDPTTAAILGFLLFTPIFGAALVAENWKSLGQKKKSEAGYLWVLGFSVFIAMSSVVSITSRMSPIVNAAVLDVMMLMAYAGSFMGWWINQPSDQCKHLMWHFPNGYPSQSWAVPVAIGASASITYFAVVVALLT